MGQGSGRKREICKQRGWVGQIKGRRKWGGIGEKGREGRGREGMGRRESNGGGRTQEEL